MIRRIAAFFLFGTAALCLCALPAPAQEIRNSATLEQTRITAGEVVCFNTVSADFAGRPLPEGYYAGELTVTIPQPVVVEAGGTLDIGPLSIGSSDPKPVLCATLGDTPLITVEPGGELVLNDVVLDLTGQGLLIEQKPGALVNIYNTDLGDDLVSWGPPLVVNQPVADYDTLWLPEGTPLTADLLPTERNVGLLYHGREESVTLAVEWDLTGYDGRTAGEWTVPGRFLDETGAELTGFLPLEWPVRWYEPRQIVVTQTRFTGDAAAAAMLVAQLPEDADTWGEISTDGGQTWTGWEDFTLEPQADGTRHHAVHFYRAGQHAAVLPPGGSRLGDRGTLAVRSLSAARRGHRGPGRQPGRIHRAGDPGPHAGARTHAGPHTHAGTDCGGRAGTDCPAPCRSETCGR